VANDQQIHIPNRFASILTFFPNTDEDEDEGGNLEPISQENIISGGRRTRGKQINWDKVNADAMDDEEDDDEDYKGAGDDNDDQMRD
jgi:hypothetical protein